MRYLTILVGGLVAVSMAGPAAAELPEIPRKVLPVAECTPETCTMTIMNSGETEVNGCGGTNAAQYTVRLTSNNPRFDRYDFHPNILNIQFATVPPEVAYDFRLVELNPEGLGWARVWLSHGATYYGFELNENYNMSLRLADEATRLQRYADAKLPDTDTVTLIFKQVREAKNKFTVVGPSNVVFNTKVDGNNCGKRGR